MKIRGRLVEIIADRNWAIVESDQGRRAFLDIKSQLGDSAILKLGDRLEYIEEIQESDSRISAIECKLIG